jgi:hypothetical protein
MFKDQDITVPGASIGERAIVIERLRSMTRSGHKEDSEGILEKEWTC